MPAAMEGWGRLSHLFATVFLASFPAFLVLPAATDVTVEAVCGGEEECSLAIYLTGFQLATTGLGSVLLMPILGNLSDARGRKNILTIPLTLQIIPLLILAWKRTTNFFYTYYSIKILTDMVAGSGILCISCSYLADSVAEGKRVAAFAMLNGILCIASVCGTFAAGLLSISRIFQVASAVAILSVVYMQVFLKDSYREKDCQEPLIMSSDTQKNDFIHKIPSPKDVFRLLKSSPIFSVAASVAFFNSLADAGVLSFLTYFFKARFHFNKDQFSLIFCISSLASTFTNVLLMPFIGPFIGEETLLCIGLFSAFLCMFLDSIAWAAWVPFATALLGMFFTVSISCIRTIISKQVGPNEQGIAQGCLLAITSVSNIVSPLVYSPLSALFLSDNAPFDFPGFCILCIGLSYLIGMILSLVIKIMSFNSRDSRHQTLC